LLGEVNQNRILHSDNATYSTPASCGVN
jgi:hypothetical protein